MSYKLRAYRVANGAACPEAIILHLLLYAFLCILKHETWDGRVAANELHEISRTTKMGEASLSFLFKLSMPSLHLLMPPMTPVHTMRPASSRDAGPPTCRALLPIAVAISFTVANGFPWITSETALPVVDNTFAPMTLPTSLTTLPPTLLPSAEPLTWSLNLVSRSLFGGQTPSQATESRPPIPDRRNPQLAHLELQSQANPVLLTSNIVDPNG